MQSEAIPVVPQSADGSTIRTEKSEREA